MNEGEMKKERPHALTSVWGLSGVGKTAWVKQLPPQLLESGGEWFAFGKEHSIVAKKMDVSSVYEEVRAGLDSMTDKKYEWWKKKMVRLLQSCRVHEMVIGETIYLACIGHPRTLLDRLRSAKVVVLKS